MPGDVAEQRVSAIEARGLRPGTGPNFANGVRPDEVGKRLKLNYPLPALTEAEQADVEGRAEQLTGLSAPERSAIDEETDRRFWQQTGKPKGTKLSATGAADAASRTLWMRTRDEVMRDRNRIAALPARTRSLLLPNDKPVTAEQYATVLRIADKLGSSATRTGRSTSGVSTHRPRTSRSSSPPSTASASGRRPRARSTAA